jgi:hypothetical protein
MLLAALIADNVVVPQVDSIVAFLKERGLEVFYEPAEVWLPQRAFANEEEANAIAAAQDAVLQSAGAKSVPAGAEAGHLHATPLIAYPPTPGMQSAVEAWVS